MAGGGPAAAAARCLGTGSLGLAAAVLDSSACAVVEPIDHLLQYSHCSLAVGIWSVALRHFEDIS